MPAPRVPGFCRHRMRRALRGNTTQWLRQAVRYSAADCAIGWHDLQGNLTMSGLRIKAMIRAELARRAANQEA